MPRNIVSLFKRFGRRVFQSRTSSSSKTLGASGGHSVRQSIRTYKQTTMKIFFSTFVLIILFSSCGPTTVIKEVHNDYFLNGKKSIDSLKELSVQEGLKGNFGRIKELCELVAKLDSNDADNLSRLSMIYMIEKSFAKGLDAVNRSIKLDTGNHYRHNFAFKACLFNELNQQDSADFYFNKMLRTNNYGLDLNAIVQSYFIFKNNDKGYQYNDLILKYYPFNEDANLTEAMRVYQTKPSEAIEILNRLETKIKMHQVLHQLHLLNLNLMLIVRSKKATLSRWRT
jgi:tetratricopeptide (TPR) repeat protein